MQHMPHAEDVHREIGSNAMYWSSIPDFGDSFAKTHTSVEEISGATIAEVLYGAKDPDGNPCSPENDADGHGRWLALESGGTYQMLLWQHPRSSGGKLELALGMGEDPINTIVLTVRTKEDLVSKAQAVVQAKNYGAAAARTMTELMDQWKAAKGWRTPREDELWEAFHTARTEFRAGREAQRKEAKAAKTALAEEAEAALAAHNFRGGARHMQDLMNRWKSVPSAGHDVDEQLWSRFNGARKAFFDAQHEDYERRRREQEERIAAKEALIVRAQTITDAHDYSRQSTDAMRALAGDWKTVGFCGREKDSELWTRFRAAQDPFWNERKKYNERRHAEWEARHAAWCERMEGVIAAKERQLERLNERVDVLEYQSTSTSDEQRRKSLLRQLDEVKADISSIEHDIADIRRQMAR